MKSLVEKINESIVNEVRANVNEAKKKTVKTTVGEYVAWYFGVDDFDEIDPMDDFQSTDFDPTSLEEFFKGSYTAQYEFLADHKDVKITVTQEETEYDDISVEFTVGKVTFTPVAMDFYKK
jgi:hypothetical protein